MDGRDPSFLDGLKTGDLILFSGRELVSYGIRLATHSRWSHIGLVVRLEGSGTLAIWESNAQAILTDLECNTEHAGVQLVSLRERVSRYEGYVGVRRIDPALTDEQIALLHAARNEFRGRSYERNRVEEVRAIFKGRLGNTRDDPTSLFCSELVAETYQRMGVLNPKPSANEYTPGDFSSRPRWRLPFVDPHTLTPEEEFGPARA